MTIAERAAYSRLPALLRERGWTVADLARRLRAAGQRVDRKTLYRLARPIPVGKADVAIVRAICDALGVGLDDFFRFAPPLPDDEPDEYWELPEDRVRRLNELGRRHADGDLTPAELRELEDLVAEHENLVLHNARVRLWRRASDHYPQARAHDQGGSWTSTASSPNAPATAANTVGRRRS